MSGPEGCGKNLLIRQSTNWLQDEFVLTFNVAVLHCNARTSSKDVLQKLRQFCSITTGTSGRIYRLEEGRTFVLPDVELASEILTFLGSNRSGVVETTWVSPLVDDADIRTA